MTTRRKFLQASLAGTGLLMTSAAFGGATPAIASILTPAGQRLRLNGAVFDSGKTQSLAFGQAAEREGLPTFGFGRDITAVWTRVVELWRSKPVAIAGLTTLTPLLLLEQSARDHGLRVVFRAEHRSEHAGALTHTLSGPGEIIRAFESMSQEKNFGSSLARAIVHCPRDARGRETAVLHTAQSARRANDSPLYSWVFAPRRPSQQGTNA